MRFVVVVNITVNLASRAAVNGSTSKSARRVILDDSAHLLHVYVRAREANSHTWQGAQHLGQRRRERFQLGTTTGDFDEYGSDSENLGYHHLRLSNPLCYRRPPHHQPR